MRCIASGLFLVAHGLLVLEHIAIGTALHGVAELFLAPWGPSPQSLGHHCDRINFLRVRPVGEHCA